MALYLQRITRRTLKSTVVFVLILTGSSTLIAQEPATPQRSVEANSPAPAPLKDKPFSGTIKGRVVAAGRVSANAIVSARPVNAGARGGRSTLVDSEGRFELKDLPPAVYTVVATAPGYIDETIANGDPFDLPRHLVGSQLSIRMIKGGVITGVVTNAKGDPVVGINVRATPIDRREAMAYAFGNLSETDDRGVYRIYGLIPGQYIVSAGARGSAGFYNTSGYDLDMPTYFPSETRDTALPITVQSAEETTGIDIKYRSTPGYLISGTIKGKIDAEVVSLLLSHSRNDSMVAMTGVSPNDATQSFKFDGLEEGEYDLTATVFQNNTVSGARAKKTVVVRGGDVTGVELTLSPLSTFEGTLKLEPARTEQKCDQRASLLSEVLISGRTEIPNRTTGARVRPTHAEVGSNSDANTTFALRNMDSGKFRLDIRLPTNAWYLREIKMPPAAPAKGETPKSAPWQGTRTIKSGESIKGVVIEVGQDAASLRGTVSRGKGAPIPEGLQVHLVPAERDHANTVLRYYETNVRGDGSFALSHLAPGRYFVTTRIQLASEPGEPSTPAAWSGTTRAALRRQAEASNTVIELKPCERLSNYALNMSPSP